MEPVFAVSRRSRAPVRLPVRGQGSVHILAWLAGGADTPFSVSVSLT